MSRSWWPGGGGEEPVARAARGAKLEPGGPRRKAQRLAPERQRDRDREVRSQPAASLQNRAPLRSAGRNHLPRRRSGVIGPQLCYHHPWGGMGQAMTIGEQLAAVAPPRVELGGFWRRLGALVVDALLL